MNEYEHQTYDRDSKATIRPRIYVASVADYNNGHLHGKWLDAAQPVEDLNDQVNAMLRTSTQPNAEEYAIHDHEGWHGWTPNEYTALGTIARAGAGLVEHGPAFGHWLHYTGEITDDATERFEGAYLGEWTSMLDYAEHLTEDIGVSIQVDPESWSHYVHFDHQTLARDLEVELHAADSRIGGIFLFDPTG
ncbi:MAG: antirestriction protein ArdA [Actinomycetota bacterium]